MLKNSLNGGTYVTIAVNRIQHLHKKAATAAFFMRYIHHYIVKHSNKCFNELALLI